MISPSLSLSKARSLSKALKKTQHRRQKKIGAVELKAELASWFSCAPACTSSSLFSSSSFQKEKSRWPFSGTAMRTRISFRASSSVAFPTALHSELSFLGRRAAEAALTILAASLRSSCCQKFSKVSSLVLYKVTT